MYLGLTSGRLKGEDVYTSGFANYFVSKENISKIYQELDSRLKESKNSKATIEEVLKKYHKGD